MRTRRNRAPIAFPRKRLLLLPVATRHARTINLRCGRHACAYQTKLNIPPINVRSLISVGTRKRRPIVKFGRACTDAATRRRCAFWIVINTSFYCCAPAVFIESSARTVTPPQRRLARLRFPSSDRSAHDEIARAIASFSIFTIFYLKKITTIKIDVQD